MPLLTDADERWLELEILREMEIAFVMERKVVPCVDGPGGQPCAYH